MRSASVRLLFSLFLLLFVMSLSAQNYFRDVPEATMQVVAKKRVIIPQKYRTLQLDTTSVLSFLKLMPAEKNVTNRDMAPEISIPMPDGTSARFHIWESSVLAPELAAANPGIRTFTGQGIDDKTATIKVDWTEFGFHAMISSPVTGAVFIDPYDIGTRTNYIAYFKSDYKKAVKYFEYSPKRGKGLLKNLDSTTPDQVDANICVGTQLRTYRLAVACTHEYAIAATGLATPTKAQVLAKITTTVNRVNGVYEKELSIRLTLVATESNVIFNTAAGDQFSSGANDDPYTLINESQTVIDGNIGSANYDVGHTFSTGAGGLANVGVICQGGAKAMGVTGSPSPTGDPYDIDYVAHELGHEFGADHTFNSALGACDGNQSSVTNVEPGSGSTIMAYAGICDADNLQTNSDAQFHTISFDEIVSYTNVGLGKNCPGVTATGNAAPVVSTVGTAYTIPVSTPFILTGSATDANGDALTYSWEQVDAGGPWGGWNTPSGNAPLFRSFPPVSTGTRYFPKLSNVISNSSTIGEILPSYARTMHFRLTARDNKAGGGGVCYAGVTVTAVVTGSQFAVTSPNASGIVWNVNDFQTVTWNTGGTGQAPISAANVSIELSTDGGLTYPVIIAASTPNDGTEEIQVPNNVTTQARIRVKAVGNIFYDISNNNFTIQTAPAATFVFNNPAPVVVCSGTSGTATLKSGSLKSFSTAIALSASLNPAGTTVSFGTTTLTPGNSTTVTLNNTNTLSSGTYTVRVTGVAGSVTQTRDISFVVGGPSAPTLTSPANDATGVVVQPNLSWSSVVGATSYTVEISTSSTFSTIDQTISGLTTPSATVTTALTTNTVYYWRVKSVNSCGTGTPSAGNRFKTGISSCFPSSDIPKDIPSAGPQTITSTLTVPAVFGVTITDLNVVGLIGTHSYVHDLVFTLIGPDNTSVVLIDSICDGYIDFNLNLDDQAVSTTIACPPSTGATQRPKNPLAAFNGKSSAGAWTLKIDDRYDMDGGTLTGWGLNFNSGSINCTTIPTPFSTTYTFTGNGNWNVASNWSNNTIPPSTLPAGGNIVINHTAGGQCVLNISQTISAGASITVLTGKNLVVNGALTIK